MNYLLPNTVLNRSCYKIVRFIAQGGFGITYLAKEIGYFKQSGFGDEKYNKARLPETVVIKELYHSDYCHRDETTGIINISNSDKKIEFEKLVHKQLEEGKILRGLNHPNIINTRDIFKENDTAYMVMDYVESIDLEESIRINGKISNQVALKYIRQILSATSYIHQRKVLHLDIKPSNILISKETDEAILIDFGASLTYNDDSQVKGKTSKLITGMSRNFAPNEQAEIENLKHFDATFDTYAIGATLYNMLTGERPPFSSLVSTGRERIAAVSQLSQGQASEYLDAVIIKAMSPKFYDRFKDVAEFEQVLEKEEKYSTGLIEIRETVALQDYHLALEKICQMEQLFLITESLQKLKGECNAMLLQNRNEREYEICIEKGKESYKNQDFATAKTYYDKASLLYPDREEPITEAALCESRINELDYLKMVNILFLEAKENLAASKFGITDEHRSKAKSNLEQLLKINPAHGEAMQLLEEMQAAEKMIYDNLKFEANILFENEQYAEAREKYVLINQTKKSDNLVLIRLSYLSIEAIQKFNFLREKTDKWVKHLQKIALTDKNKIEEFIDIKKEYFQLIERKVIDDIGLPATRLKGRFLQMHNTIVELDKNIELKKQETEILIPKETNEGFFADGTDLSETSSYNRIASIILWSLSFLERHWRIVAFALVFLLLFFRLKPYKWGRDLEESDSTKNPSFYKKDTLSFAIQKQSNETRMSDELLNRINIIVVKGANNFKLTEDLKPWVDSVENAPQEQRNLTVVKTFIEKCKADENY